MSLVRASACTNAGKRNTANATEHHAGSGNARDRSARHAGSGRATRARSDDDDRTCDAA